MLNVSGAAKVGKGRHIYYMCRFTCHPGVKRYEHKRKACLPHTPKLIISAFTCTVNIHVDVKSEKRKCTRGVPHIYPFTPHGYLPTLLQAIHSPEGTKKSISDSFSSRKEMITWIRNRRSRDQLLEGRGRSLGWYHLKRSSRSTFHLTKILIMWTIRVTKILIM